MEAEIQPIINRYWSRAEFPHQVIKQLAALGIAGYPYEGYGCPGGRFLTDGTIYMELARVDTSMERSG